MMMKVFVFAYDRYTSMTTSLALAAENVRHTVLCHTPEAAEKFIHGGRIGHTGALHVTNQPKGLAYNRNAALDLMEPDEWAVFLVDDFLQATQFNDYDARPVRVDINTWPTERVNAAFKTKLTIGQLISHGRANIALAESIGAHLIGFASNENPMFLKQHYRTWALADGRAWFVRRSDLRFDERVHSIDDYCWTARNLRRFGCVLVDNWLIPRCARYTDGGYGTIAERMPQKLKEARYLCEAYGEIIHYAQKKGWPTGGHVQITTNRKSITITQQMIDHATKQQQQPQ